MMSGNGYRPALLGQSYVERPPDAALAGVVLSTWIQQVAPDAMPYAQRNIPTGGVELLCPLGGVPRIVGPMTLPIVEVLAPGTTIVGIRFHPGGAQSALGLPVSELVDLTLAADELWGGAALRLGELVNHASSPRDALAALQRDITERIVQSPSPDPLVLEAVRLLRWRRADVGSLTSSLHVSERNLRRRCRTAVGLAPKVLHRILRFQGFLALAQYALARGAAATDGGLARLAADAGYADQPHLTRECRRLTGVSPGAFLAGAEHSCAVGHDHSASFMPLLQADRGTQPGRREL